MIREIVLANGIEGTPDTAAMVKELIAEREATIRRIGETCRTERDSKDRALEKLTKILRNPTLHRIAQNEERIELLEQSLTHLIAHLMTVNADKDEDGKLNWTGTRELHVLCNLAMRVVSRKR